MVAFSSGNSYATCVNYPARLSTVIAVGAFGNDGIVSDYSNEGPTLDIVAPSNDISSNGFLSGAGVRTTDRMGGSGYSSGNYTTGFGGTSAACPVVAGVAALVLSVDPSLTEAEVKNILYTTAIDMGSSGLDNTYGWGRVNALGAVQAANGGGGGGGNTCTSTVSLPYSEGFESGIGAWTQATGDDLDWTRRSGGTPSSNTGPSGAAAGSWYMYVEASSPNYPSKNTIFNSPCFDLTGVSSPTFDFSYHMLGGSVGTLDLQASTDGSSWTTVWTRSGTQGSSWNSASVDLSSYSGEDEFRLRFSGTTASSWQGDMCIDGLSFTDGGGGGGGSCPTVDFSANTVTAYGNGQDQGSSQVQDGGATLFLQNNAWKDISLNYTVTANTVLEFEFRSTDQGEIHGIGFDNNESISSSFTFKVHGTQNWGITNYDNYSGSSYTTYTIPVGSFYTGSFNRLFFVCDDDAGSSSNAYFRNVKIYEGSCQGSNATVNSAAGSIQAQIANDGEYDLSIYPSPVQSQLNVEIEGAKGYIAGSIHDLSGKQVWSGSVQEQSRIEVSQLPSGMYLFQVQMEDGSRLTRRVVKN